VKRKKRRRSRFAIYWIAGVILLGAALNVYLALRPASLSARIRAALASALACSYDFESFDWRWSGWLELRSVSLSEPGASPGHPGAEIISARAVRVEPDLLALLCGSFRPRSVVLESPVLRIARRDDGRWNLEDILRRPAPAAVAASTESPAGPATGGATREEPAGAADAKRGFEIPALPFLLIESGTIELTDPKAWGDGTPRVLSDVQASIRRGDERSLRIDAAFRPEFARRLDLSGTLALSGPEPVLRVRANARKVEVALVASRILPREAAAAVEGMRPKGLMDLSGDFEVSRSGGLVARGIGGRLQRCDLEPPGWPYPIRGLEATLEARDRTIEIDSISGSCGDGKLAGKARIELAEAWLAPGPFPAIASWSFQGNVDSITLDQRALLDRLREAMPPDVASLLERFALRGRLGAAVEVFESKTFPPRGDDLAATLRLQGIDFMYRGFPYTLEDLHGELRFEKRWLRFGLVEGQGGGISVKVSGKGIELERAGEVDVVIRTGGVPLDERFRAALPRDITGIWDDFRVLGSADAVISITRAPWTGPQPPSREELLPRISVTAEPRDVRMSFSGFPYEIRGITGLVHLDTLAGRITFDGLRGSHGRQLVTGSGALDFKNRGLMKVAIACDHLTYDAELAAALSPGARMLISQFGFEGSVKADVSVQMKEPKVSEVIADLELIEGSVQHRDFPYRLSLGGGRIRAIGDHTIEFRDIRTPEGSKPAAVANGSLTTAGSRRTLGFEIDVRELDCDDRLVRALPPDLSSFVTEMNLAGVFGGKLEGIYELDEADPSRGSIRYAGKGVTARDASVDFGLEVRNMTGTGVFAGGRSPGKPHYFVGEAFVESGWFNRVHVTKGEVDFVFNEEHSAVEAARRGPAPAGAYTPPPAIVERLSGDGSAETFQMLLHSKDLYGGEVDGFLYVGTGSKKDLAGDLRGKDLQMSLAAEDVFGASSTGTQGAGRGRVSFQGKSGDPRSITGEGEGFIEKATLVELPLFLGLLNILFGENTARHYFNEVDMRFRIADGKFVAESDGIEIRSAAVKLRGGGTLDFSGNLDLTFQPRLLGFKIPVLEQLLTLVKKGLAQIWVLGDLRRPRVEFVTGAGMLRIGIEPGSSPDGKTPLPKDLRKELR